MRYRQYKVVVRTIEISPNCSNLFWYKVGLLTRWDNSWFIVNGSIAQPSFFCLIRQTNLHCLHWNVLGILHYKKYIYCLSDQPFGLDNKNFLDILVESSSNGTLFLWVFRTWNLIKEKNVWTNVYTPPCKLNLWCNSYHGKFRCFGCSFQTSLSL